MKTLHAREDTTDLPHGYRELRAVDLKKDKRYAVTIQGLVLLTALVAVGIARLISLPLESGWPPAVTAVTTVSACLLYMAAHEATHGAVLHLVSGVRPSYAVRFPFLTTGSRAYLTRRSAVMVALAPFLVWGLVLGGALLVLPQDYLLTTYIVLALNVAGSAGDFVEVHVVTRQPATALIHDDGTSMRVHVPDGSVPTSRLSRSARRTGSRVAGRVEEDRTDTVVGVAVALGAGLGTTVGIIVGGGTGIAVGAGVGAGLGVVLGAAWDAMHRSR